MASEKKTRCWAIALHGGAGVDPNLPFEKQDQAARILNRCLQLGVEALRSNLHAIDVVELVVSIVDFMFFDSFDQSSAIGSRPLDPIVKVIHDTIVMELSFDHCLDRWTRSVEPILSIHRLLLPSRPRSILLNLQVRELETDPFFNSGRGSALTRKGTVEMEASIMDGDRRRCGAVSGVTTVKNPVSLARLVMDRSPHSYLAFHGAEEFARQQVFLQKLNIYSN